MEFQFESLGPTLRIVVLAFLFVFAILIVGLAVLLAMLPGWIAKARSHPQAEAVAVCGWIGLPTGILWVVALVWAFLRQTSNASQAAVFTDSFAKLDAQMNALESSIAALESSRREKRS